MTQVLLRLMKDEREHMVQHLLKGEIQKDNIGSKNFALGKIELLDELLEEELFNDLIAGMEDLI